MQISVWAVIVVLTGTVVLAGDEPPSEDANGATRLNPNVPMKTLGGRQFWADVACFHDWRIQQNVFTKHCRLLDGFDVRQAWGTLEQCQAKLAEVRRERKLTVMSGEVVVLVHGICRSSKSMNKLKKHLRAQGLQTYSFDYPSTRISIEDSADCLQQVLSSMEGVERIHLIGFSLGGLVVRSCLHRHPDDRIGRVLLVGTPNRGAELADTFRSNMLFKIIFGQAGQQLSCTDLGLAATLPAPPGEFAVIAGARNTESGYNPLITGDNDGTVSLASARLTGACDFLIVPGLHPFLIGQKETLAAAYSYIHSGKLRPDGERQPITD